jgi:hypothetical protein
MAGANITSKADPTQTRECGGLFKLEPESP